MNSVVFRLALLVATVAFVFKQTPSGVPGRCPHVELSSCASVTLPLGGMCP